MYKKVSFIIFLAISLAAFLFIRHYYKNSSEEPRIIDRLPEGDFLLRANVLDVARETSAMLYFNKVQFRDFFSYEFLLGQGKSYGLNLQRPVYVFANETGDWGAMLHVSDTSKMGPGLERLNKLLDLKDTVMYNHRVFYWEKEKAYLSFGSNWLFIYKGEFFKRQLFHVIHAKKNEVLHSWHAFLTEKQFKNQRLVMASNWKNMKKYGIEKAMFAHDSDSVSFTVMSYFKSSKDWTFKQREGGKSLAVKPTTDRFLNIHLNVDEFRNHPEDPLYRLLAKLSKKISFPLQDFMSAWEGDLSFRQGGLQTVRETYIESVLDDNFNVTEVQSVKDVKVPGFSLALLLNKNSNKLISRLFQKGIMTREGDKFRFLVSPTLNYSIEENYHIFYSGESRPKLAIDNLNNGLWNEKGTKFNFQLDSLNNKEAFGTLTFPVERIIRRNKFF
jgi:hypothetical protein